MDTAQDDRRIPCEVYSRVVGYLRPVGSWNTAKQFEFKERVTFNSAGRIENTKGDSEDERSDNEIAIR